MKLICINIPWQQVLQHSSTIKRWPCNYHNETIRVTWNRAGRISGNAVKSFVIRTFVSRHESKGREAGGHASKSIIVLPSDWHVRVPTGANNTA
jgi:hypothetical protein